MGKFKFKLETVLNLRRKREEDALRALAQSQRVYQHELSKKSKLVSDLSEALIRRENLGIDAIGIDAFQLEQSFITGTKQRIIQQDQALVRASRGVEKALRAYLYSKRQTRMIEILREKQFKEFRKALAKKEQKELDELSVMRARLTNQDPTEEQSA